MSNVGVALVWSCYVMFHDVVDLVLVSVCVCPLPEVIMILSRDALFIKDDGVISAFLGCVVSHTNEGG